MHLYISARGVDDIHALITLKTRSILSVLDETKDLGNTNTRTAGLKNAGATWTPVITAAISKESFFAAATVAWSEGLLILQCSVCRREPQIVLSSNGHIIFGHLTPIRAAQMLLPPQPPPQLITPTSFSSYAQLFLCAVQREFNFCL